ncbi:Peptidyl-prolyl cis-trans isomerase FKBP2 [Acipenser ruthenus]|uniref:Peptidyl-prolyl cis-trans isomerase FKBP2 n=1 Tax=Acipenser ruthenus TaxID=7906 RepID=A0A444V280_ACIRT|nr:Peptidyl-prolyl cis-trans isomerase FKBP2 [Acipenser ruthenus]
MKAGLVGAVLLVALCSSFCHGDEGKKKLQIGIKKRVDNCPLKSRKGDVLHMHYTQKRFSSGICKALL